MRWVTEGEVEQEEEQEAEREADAWAEPLTKAERFVKLRPRFRSHSIRFWRAR